MTRNRTLVLTGFSAALYLFLCWVFADHLFSGNWWNSHAIASSNIFTYLFLAIIVIAGLSRAQRAPLEATRPAAVKTAPDAGQFDDPVAWKLLVGNVAWAIVWMPVRFFVGREWLVAGEEKLRSDGWMSGGAALKGYWTGVTAVPATGRAAITYGWFRRFLQYMLAHQWYTWFAKLIAIGETLVGIGIILGALVGLAAFFGTVLNFNFQLAGSASTNPVLFGLGVLLVLAWKVAGWWGLDRSLLPRLGTPWTHGKGVIGKGEARVASHLPGGIHTA